MATGKELVRMMSCGIWEDYITSRKDYLSSQIFDNEGEQISLNKAKTETFCCAKILFKGCPEGELKLLGLILQIVAGTSSEQMFMGIKRKYGTQQIEIS